LLLFNSRDDTVQFDPPMVFNLCGRAVQLGASYSPANQISRLPGGERYKQNMIQQLKKRKQIKTFYKDSLRGYRLLLPTKEMLLEQNPDRFTF